MTAGGHNPVVLPAGLRDRVLEASLTGPGSAARVLAAAAALALD